MRKRNLTISILFVLALAVGAIAERIKLEPVYKVTRISNTEVGIACMNGADPTGKKIGNTVIMSCGKE